MFNTIAEAYNREEKDLLDKTISTYIIQNLEQGENNVAFVESANVIEKIDSVLENYGLKEGSDKLVITSKKKKNASIEQKDIIKDYFKNKALFNNSRIFMYNSCIVKGVYTLTPNFKRAILYLDNFGNCKDTITANDNLNAIGRVQLTKNVSIDNVVFKIKCEDYEKYYNDALLNQSYFIIYTYTELNNLNVLYNNYNRIFKKELFISLLQFKGNTLNDNNNIINQFSVKNKKKKKNLKNISIT
jgi:hypothetical protein